MYLIFFIEQSSCTVFIFSGLTLGFALSVSVFLPPPLSLSHTHRAVQLFTEWIGDLYSHVPVIVTMAENTYCIVPLVSNEIESIICV